MEILINKSFAEWLQKSHDITYLHLIKLQEQYLESISTDECSYFSNDYCNNMEYPKVKCEAIVKHRCFYNKPK